MSAGSTIHVSQEVKALLDFLKEHPRQSYDEVLRKVLEAAGKRPIMK